MIKGCRKNVVYVRNTGSEIFEEAFFIVNDQLKNSVVKERDLINEANRLISEIPEHEYSLSSVFEPERHKINLSFLWFAAGVAVTALLNALIYFVV